MDTWFSQSIDYLQGSPVLQGILIILSTFILEDATTVGVGLVVASGAMSFSAAFAALCIGIAGGDYGLYLAGRGVESWLRSSRLIDPDRLTRAKAWCQQHGIKAVLIARFVPGMRLVTYLAAGFLRLSQWQFITVVVAGTLVWTFALLALAVRFGVVMSQHLGRYKLLFGVLLVLSIVLTTRWLGARHREREAGASPPVDEPAQSLFEFWPPLLFYFPVLLYGLWLALRFRGLTLPTAANPAIHSGGMIMESKSQILSLVSSSERCWVAPWVLYDHRSSSGGAGAEDLDQACEEAMAAMRAGDIRFPVVVKPDVGQRGAGVRPVRDPGELRAYLAAAPAGTRLMLQELVDYPCEVGILYYRYPHETSGRLFSITRKEFPAVVGDGRQTLRALVLADRRLRLVSDVYFKRHQSRLDWVVPAGERFPLVFAGNHCQGAIFRDGAALATPELAARIDAISRSMPGFYFGRYDVRYESDEALMRGEKLRIVEINGAGAEATHIWDPKMRLLAAYEVLFRQFRILFEIGATNRAKGHRPLPLAQLLRDLRTYRRASRRYPATH